MTVGLPGTGIGAMFYILLAIYMPLVQLRRKRNGSSKPHHFKILAPALFLSVFIILVLYGEAKLLVWFFEWMIPSVDDSSTRLAGFADWIPASIVPTLTIMPFLMLSQIVIWIQFARLVFSTGQND